MFCCKACLCWKAPLDTRLHLSTEACLPSAVHLHLLHLLSSIPGKYQGKSLLEATLFPYDAPEVTRCSSNVFDTEGCQMLCGMLRLQYSIAIQLLMPLVTFMVVVTVQVSDAVLALKGVV